MGHRGTFGAMPHALHPSLGSLAFLVGSCRGDGEVTYPGIAPFRHREELSFEDVGDAFLLVTESSWTPDGEPLLEKVG
jgi:hypothetical protein